MPERQEILHTIAAAILRLPTSHVVRVGIDGVDGAGKSMFGDELAQVLAAAGRRRIRASVDAFDNPRAIRYRLGRQSPQGYFRDSYDYEQLKALLLDPLSPGGNGRSPNVVRESCLREATSLSVLFNPLAKGKVDGGGMLATPREWWSEWGTRTWWSRACLIQYTTGDAGLVRVLCGFCAGRGLVEGQPMCFTRASPQPPVVMNQDAYTFL